jgi:hypothetical protein
VSFLVSTFGFKCSLCRLHLGRVKCRCPLHTSGCSWTGDFSEVSAHLTNSQSHLAGQDYAANNAQVGLVLSALPGGVCTPGGCHSIGYTGPRVSSRSATTKKYYSYHTGWHQLNAFRFSLPGVRLVTWIILGVIS